MMVLNGNESRLVSDAEALCGGMFQSIVDQYCRFNGLR
jgi:hypothetical protein